MHLALATADDVRALDRLTHDAWGAGLSVDAFSARERRLRSGWWPRERLRTWTWRDGDGIVASCETYEVQSTVGGRIGRAWEIASVFTPRDRRGHGYASALLNALGARLGDEPAAQALVLFSDVGLPMYERLGFVAVPAFDRFVAAEDGDPDDGVDARFADTELAEVYARMRVPATSPCDFRVAHSERELCLWPSLAQLDWQLDHARTWAETTGRRTLSRCGARLGDDAIVWADDDEGGRLLVLWLVAGDDTRADALLRCAARTAGAAGLPFAVAWESPGVNGTLGKRRPRDGHLPMIRPLSADVDPARFTYVPRALWV